MVIVSTVRNNASQNTGIIGLPEFLHAALTRARKTVIVVGDQKVGRDAREELQTLTGSPHWASFIEFMRQKGCIQRGEQIRKLPSPWPKARLQLIACEKREFLFGC